MAEHTEDALRRMLAEARDLLRRAEPATIHPPTAAQWRERDTALRAQIDAATVASAEACRVCKHRVVSHNLSGGCLFCSCFSTHLDAAPRTIAERAVEPIEDGEYAEGFTAPAPLDVLSQEDVNAVAGVTTVKDMNLLMRLDAAIDEMGSRERYDALLAVPYAERHPCPIAECNLSAEEHHRLAFGMIAENRTLRRRVAEMEAGQ